MTLRDDISMAMHLGEKASEFEVTVFFREVTEDSNKYVVAECLEIPGCVSQGQTQEEAEINIKDAMQSCLVIMYTDAMRRIMDSRMNRDLRGISSQRRLTISRPQPELVYA